MSGAILSEAGADSSAGRAPGRSRRVGYPTGVSKKTNKRKIRKKNKANHGKRPNVGRG